MNLFAIVTTGVVLGFLAGLFTGGVSAVRRTRQRLWYQAERNAEAHRLLGDISKAWVRYRRADAARVSQGAGKAEALAYRDAREALEELLGTERPEPTESGIVRRDGSPAPVELAS
jgi:hypothetical protein